MEKTSGLPENSASQTFTEAKALSLLGERRFFSAERVIKFWNQLINEKRSPHSVAPLAIPANPSICYREETLKNIFKDSAWYLIYDPGFSLKENRAITGTDVNRQPCHRPDNDWWLSQREDYWAGKKAEPAYHLIRMKGLFTLENAAQDWDWQDEQIREMGEAFQRAPTHLVASACIACFILNQERYLEVDYNFGPEMDADYCFLVTNFAPTGLNLGHWLRNDWGGYWVSGLRVCVERKPDF